MEPKINNILYATDLSPNSGYVFRYAFDIARKHGARIHILHVFKGLTPTAEAVLSVSLPDWRAIRKNNMIEMAEAMQEKLSELEGKDPGESKCVASMLVAEGDPVDEILKRAEQWKCEIIIMGTHGKGLISSLFGSVSEKVLRQTSRAVHIIPIPKGANGTAYCHV